MKRLMFSMATLALSASFAMAQDSGRVRVLHGSPDAPAVDIYVNGGKVWEALPFREYTEYLVVPAGVYTVDIIEELAQGADGEFALL